MDQDARVDVLESRLAQAQRELAEAKSKLSVLNDQSVDLHKAREECDKLEKDAKTAQTTVASLEQHNEVLRKVFRRRGRRTLV